MSGLLHMSGHTRFRTANLGGRNYDYTKIYNPAKPGEEANPNARVWNVYLDEAESYDADMIEGFRGIIDGLLIFASLFSAVVVTFVAQTSQALKPDNLQIMVSLLIENNQLLRAAGNRTSMITVPTVDLGIQTYTSADVWVNGLFFISLALSLVTALLTVLAKQWIQAYTAIVPGDARTRALIRHFRFQGLMKWKLGDIIESLPLILHGSLILFLTGLALYVYQLSCPIGRVMSVINGLALFFYFGTSMIPAFDIACPYRTPFMFSLVHLMGFAFHTTRCTFSRLWHTFTRKSHSVSWPEIPTQSLKMAEYSRVFEGVVGHSYYLVSACLACNSLDWIFKHSSNHSVNEVVTEGACGLLDQWCQWSSIMNSDNGFQMTSEQNNLSLSMVVYSLSQLPNMTSSTSTTEDDVDNSIYGRLIGNVIKLPSFQSLLDGPIINSDKDWQEQIKAGLINAYKGALSRRYHALSRRLLNWGYPNLLQSEFGHKVLLACAQHGDEEDIQDLVDRGMNLGYRDPNGWTALHHAAICNMDGTVALVEQAPALMSVQASGTGIFKGYTAFDLAVYWKKSDVVAYFLDHGASPPSNALHAAVRSPYKPMEIVELLLDRGWDRIAKDIEGKTPIDIARYEHVGTIANHLEHYQTVRLPPSPTTLKRISNGKRDTIS